jgi:transposase InsO family protein
LSHSLRQKLHRCRPQLIFGGWGSPWENGYIESFNARLRDELLNGEIFYTLREAQIVIESWRRSGRTPHLDTSHQYRRCSCLPLPRGRLRISFAAIFVKYRVLAGTRTDSWCLVERSGLGVRCR